MVQFTVGMVSWEISSRFVIQSPMPDAECLFSCSLGSILSNQLDTVGLGSFLEVIPELTRQQQIQALRKGTSEK